MAMKQFWTNVQTAARFMRSRPNIVPAAFDHEQIENALRQSTFWLTSGSIKGYDPDDLEPLNDEERKRLKEGVAEFQEVAKNDREMASVIDGPRGRTVASVAKIIEPERIERGIDGFLKILEIVRPDKYFDAEAFVIGKQIENLIHDKLPEWVRGMTFETRNDSIGEPALYITVLAEDEALASEVLRENSRRVDDLLSDAAREVCPERWPYLTFWTVSGQDDVRKADGR